MQEKMWRIFVPEKGVRFGDQRFWVLIGIVGGLHLFNNYRESQRPPESDLPAGAVRRLPDGRLLMEDGSVTAKGTEIGPHKPPTLHQEKAEMGGVINNARRAVRDAA
jgi:hypothetical protein